MKNVGSLIFLLFAFMVATTTCGTSCLGFPFPELPPSGEVRLLFPQFVNAGGVVATIMVVNPRQQMCTATVEFFDQVGHRLPVSIGGNVNTWHAFMLPGGGTKFWRTDPSNEPLTLGSARVRATGPVTGNIAFSGATGPAGFGSSEPFYHAVMPIEQDATGETRSSIAVTVFGPDPVVMTLTARDGQGNEITNGTASAELVGRGQKALYIDELIPNLVRTAIQGSIEIESNQLIAVIGAHSTGLRLAAIPAESTGQEAVFSFEGDLSGWQTQALDVKDAQSVADWSIIHSGDRRSDGIESLKFYLDNMTDAGKIWIQRAFAVQPSTRYRVRIRYSFATSDYGDQNLWRIISGVLSHPPKSADELPYQGSTGNGAGQDIGYVWLDKAYDQEVESGPDGLLYVLVGVWGTWETPRTYFVDELAVSIQELQE